MPKMGIILSAHRVIVKTQWATRSLSPYLHIICVYNHESVWMAYDSSDFWANTLDKSMKVFLEETNIKCCRLRKADLNSLTWVGFIQYVELD